MTAPVDVCLVVEGAYPYVAGGVSSWVHDLVRVHADLTFHVVTLVPDRRERQMRYQLPANVLGMSEIALQEMDAGTARLRRSASLFSDIAGPLARLQSDGGGLADLTAIVEALRPWAGTVGRRMLLDSPPAWEMLQRMYEDTLPDGSFLEYFWTWRALLGGLYACLLAPLPQARVYHTVTTGYAGLLAARAKIETGRPVILTEHGIYTNERRIEITMADWLFEGSDPDLTVGHAHRDLRDLWIDTFRSYARACYDACDHVVTLYTGNQDLQLRDGADPTRMRIIPNGIDFARFSALPRDPAPRPPTVALIGRVVPIKDVKTFIRACAVLRDAIPDVQAYVLGPMEEDPEYARECLGIVRHLGLENTIRFEGQVRLDDYLPRLDAIALTSLSEAQPLVVLEAGAAGIPSVTTDVGCCRELIYGRPDEDPRLGDGGAVTAVSAPAEIGAALRELLQDPAWRAQCGRTMVERVRRYYNKVDIDRTYRALYDACSAAPDASPGTAGRPLPPGAARRTAG